MLNGFGCGAVSLLTFNTSFKTIMAGPILALGKTSIKEIEGRASVLGNMVYVF